ncbi:MAG: hypothetical protein KFB95_06240 [Simkaniaceae bacterium]|nr:MAG: hypothetical protein KFB95_06240 [Simkaniaceae bacterium]
MLSQIKKRSLVDVAVPGVIMGVALLAGSKHFIQYFPGSSKKGIFCSAALGSSSIFGSGWVFSKKDLEQKRRICAIAGLIIGAIVTPFFSKKLIEGAHLSFKGAIRFAIAETTIFGVSEAYLFFLKKTSIPTEPNPILAEPVPTQPSQKENFSEQEINDWLFGGNKDERFPDSKLGKRNQEGYAFKKTFSQIPMVGSGHYTSRIGIYRGGITDLKADENQKTAIGDSNNGDLLTGCGYAVAKAVVNAAGSNLQRDLYNTYGVPGVMKVPDYGKSCYSKTEGRGYAVTCDAHDMKKTHNIQNIEFMTVPMHNLEGVRNMYREAYEHSRDLDYIALPMAGMSHPVLKGKSELSAEIATSEFKKFSNENPSSNLKVIFVIFNDLFAENLYRNKALAL